MRLVKVTPDHEIKPFDCGDADLNGFLMNDARSYADKNIAYTFVLEDDDDLHTRLMYFDIMEM